MKQIISSFIFILFSLICFSQEYDKLVETGKRFSIGMHNGGAPFPTTSHYTLIGEDTIISTIQYKKLLKSESGEEFDPSYSLIGFIRETEDRKVYLRDLENIEGLYYDYYVQENDTIDFYNPFIKYLFEDYIPECDSDTLMIVEDVHTETILGVSRKVYQVRAFGECSYFPEVFIEGIGAKTGILNCGMYTFFALVGSGSTLLCVENTEEIIYQNDDYGYCFISSNNFKTIKEVKAFPNPCSSHFTINIDSNEHGILEIYSLSGTQILKTSTSESSKIDTSNLPVGVYILKIILIGEVKSSKLIIN